MVDEPTAQMSLGENAETACSPLLKYSLGVGTTRKIDSPAAFVGTYVAAIPTSNKIVLILRSLTLIAQRYQAARQLDVKAK
jgi:hypothetical protein